MTENDSSSQDFEVKRKRLLYRSWNRGMKETDMLLGQFADTHIGSFDARQLALYETLLQESDPDILAWIVGRESPPAKHDNDVMKLLLSFKFHE